MCVGSQYFQASFHNLGSMRAKYYTRFLLRSSEQSCADEYSGVVELNHDCDQLLEAATIEALLAQNFQMEAEHVELLNWSRLH